MKLLIATPCFNGKLDQPYVISLWNTQTYLLQNKLVDDVSVFFLGTESLISRGRNKCARYAIANGYDKLLFIDADMSWEPEYIKMLLESDKKIVGGTYPLKCYPILMNLNALPDKGGEIFGKERTQDHYAEFVKKYADEKGEVEIMHLPTGFMMIDVSVLVDLAQRKLVEKYETYQPDVAEKFVVFYDWFPVRVRNERYQSEDWAFCEIAREAGYSINLQTKAVCGHQGAAHYALGQHIIIGQKPVLP